MNKFLVFLFIVLYSGCQIFNINIKTSKPKINSAIIHANLILDLELLGKTKVKTKIELLKDSIIVSAYPIFGVELGNVVITEKRIYINQKFKNNFDTILTLNIDSEFKLKTIKKSILQLKNKKDTIHHTNQYINCMFTNYTYKNDIFLPEKIIYWNNTVSPKTSPKQIIQIEYKSVNFFNE